MQIRPGGLRSWMQLSPGQRVLKASSCNLEATSLSSLNITAYSGVSPFHVHSTYTLLFVIISGFFRSPNSSKSLKQINAGILLDKVLFVLETASQWPKSRFTGLMLFTGTATSAACFTLVSPSSTLSLRSGLIFTLVLWFRGFSLA